MWRLTATVCAFSMFASSTSGIAASKDPAASVKTKSPIKHVIILIGENRGFDHTFGVYKPKGRGQTISNLLSKRNRRHRREPGDELQLVAAIFGFATDLLLYRREEER